MPQSLAAITIHAVFSTKHREPYFHDSTLRSELHAYLGGISNQQQCPPLQIGGVADHVHILAGLHRTMSTADWIKELKRGSNAWLKKQPGIGTDFAWQNGYAAFSVSASQIPTVKQYIVNQAKHHERVSFQDEYRALLSKHGVEWNEDFAWD